MAFLAAVGAAVSSAAAGSTAATIIGATVLASAGVGIAAGVQGLMAGGKQPKDQGGAIQPPPPTPTPEDATAKAAAEVAKRRRITLLSGGNTNITEGTGSVPSVNVARKSLLGE